MVDGTLEKVLELPDAKTIIPTHLEAVFALLNEEEIANAMFRETVFKLMRRSDLWPNWSASLGSLVRTLFNAGPPADDIGSFIGHICPFNYCQIVAPNIIERHETILDAESNGNLNLLQPGTDGTPSFWSIVCSQHDIFANESSRRSMASAARTFAQGLLQLHRSGSRVSPLISELAGGSRGLDLIRHEPYLCFYMAQHVKEASPTWWDDIKLRLAALSPELWVPDDYDRRKGYSNAAEFIRQVDAAPPCDGCPSLLQFRHQLDPQDSDNPQSRTWPPRAVEVAWNRLGSFITGRVRPRQDMEMGSTTQEAEPVRFGSNDRSEPERRPAPSEAGRDVMRSHLAEVVDVVPDSPDAWRALRDADTALSFDGSEARSSGADELSPGFIQDLPHQELSGTDDVQVASGSAPPDSGGWTRVDATGDATRPGIGDVGSELPEALPATREGSTTHSVASGAHE